MVDELKSISSATIEKYKQELSALSGEVWKNPELGFKEYKAHHLLTNFLKKEGFAVECSYTGIETAFRATFGSGKPNVCVICEYDALPEIGHACGHNLIAEAGVAAGLGLKAVLESSDTPKGTVTVMGTPAEETDGGKVNLIGSSAFDGIDLAMMVHPSPINIVAPRTLAIETLIVSFIGKAAHAAAYPWEGRNALDAVVLAYNAISLLRQQMQPSWRVHGVIVSGGEDPAIIPETATLKYYIRAPTIQGLIELRNKISKCFTSAAIATGCNISIENVPPLFKEILNNNVLSQLYFSNIKKFGMNFKMEEDLTISSDMGNVSYIVPSIHPMYAIGSGEVNHTREFTAVANTAEAHKATLTAAKAMADTCIDVLTTDRLMEKIQENFKASLF